MPVILRVSLNKENIAFLTMIANSAPFVVITHILHLFK